MEEKKEVNEKKEKKATGVKSLVWGLVIALIIIIIAYLVVIGAGVYKYDWDNKVATWTTNVLPYPAALVDFNFIPMSKFNDDVETLGYYLNKQAELGEELLTIPEESTLQETVIAKLIRTELLEQLAASYGVSVSTDEVNEELTSIYDQAVGGEEEVKETLIELYKWTPEEFGKNIIEEYLLREKITEKMSDDSAINGAAYDQAKSIYDAIIAGTMDFTAAASTFSEDPGSATTGGDVGEFVAGDMVPEFFEAVAAIEIGGVTGPVQSDYGYHIIMRTALAEVEEVEGEEATEDEIEAQKYRASHILIRTQTLDEYLTTMLDEAKVYNLVD